MKKKLSLQFFLPLILGGIIFFLSFYKISDPDIWLHLKSGQVMLQDFRILDRDIFSYTRQAAPWANHSWLSQIIFYLSYRCFHLAGLYLIRYLLLAATFGLIYFSAREKVGERGAAVLTLLTILAANQRFVVRPELFTFAFIAVLLFVLENEKIRAGSRFFALPLLFAVWANIHGGFILGVVIIWLYCLGEGFALILPGGDAPPSSSGRMWRRLLLIAALSSAAVVLNPFGFHVYKYYSSEISRLSSFIYVWQPFPWTAWRNWTLSQAFFPLLIILGAFSFIRRRRQLSHLLIFLFFSYLGVKAVRNIYLFYLIIPFILAANLRGLLGKKVAARILEYLPHPLLSLVLIAVIIYPHRQRDPFLNDIHREFGWGISAVTYPVEVSKFLSAPGIRGRFFNSFGIGGYLIWKLWPERKVYLDGRLSVYRPSFLLAYNDLLLYPALFFPEQTKKWGFDLAVVDYPNPSNLPLLKWLEKSPEWGFAYFDANSALFLRDRPALHSLFTGEKLKECLRAEETPPREAYARASLLLTLGRADDALPFLRRAREGFPHSSSIYRKLARVYLIQKNWGKAEATCRRALELGGRPGPLLLIMAHLHFFHHRWAEAIATGEEALKLEPEEWRGYEMLGDAYREQGKLAEAIKTYRRGLKVEPGDPILSEKAADLYFRQGDYRQAAEWYQNISSLASQYPRARVYLAGCSAQLGDYPRAKAAYRKCAEQFPGYSQLCFYNLALLASREGKKEEAENWLKKITDPALRRKALLKTRE